MSLRKLVSRAIAVGATMSATLVSAARPVPGAMAPDFALQDQNRKEVRLSQFRGRPVQVAFYVYAFSGG